MYDFQSFDGLVPSRSTWLPKPAVLDGHHLMMTDDFEIHDRIIGMQARPERPIDPRPTVEVSTVPSRVRDRRPIDPLIARGGPR